MALTQDFFVISENDIPTLNSYNEQVADGNQPDWPFVDHGQTIQYGDFLHGYFVHNEIAPNREGVITILYPGEREELTQKLEASKSITDTQALSEMFPMIEGFFFGTGESDEGFRENVDTVLKFFETLYDDDLVGYLAVW